MLHGLAVLLVMTRIASGAPRLGVAEPPACDAADLAARVAALVGRDPFGNGPGVVTVGLDGCAVGSTGTVAYTGGFSGQVNFGTGPVQSDGSNDSDVFIVLLDPPAND